MAVTTYSSTPYRLSDEDLELAKISYTAKPKPVAPPTGTIQSGGTNLPTAPTAPTVQPIPMPQLPMTDPAPVAPIPMPQIPWADPVTGATPPPPVVPDAAPPETSTIPQVESTAELRNLTDAELNSLLDLIAARYNLTREQLAAQENNLGLTARSLEEQLAILRRDSVRGAENTASERGLLRSGIHARNIAGIDTAIAQQAAQGSLQRQASQSDIAAARAAIEANLAAEQAAAKQASASGLLQFEQGQTVQDLLATLPLAPNQLPPPLLPANPYIPNPMLPTAPSLASLFGQGGFTPPFLQSYYSNYFGQNTGGAAGGSGGSELYM